MAIKISPQNRLRPQQTASSSFLLLIAVFILIYLQFQTLFKTIPVDLNFDSLDHGPLSSWTSLFTTNGTENSVTVKFTKNLYGKETEEGMAACILTKDDNPLWPEWLAYHYQILPLRRLIVAVDPNSRTSPHSILNRYAKNGLPLDITVWENDEFIGPNSSTPDPDHLLRLQNKTSNQGENHIRRQLLFLKACLKELYFENRSWVLLTDTDEFLVPQPSASSQRWGLSTHTNTEAAFNATTRASFIRPNETVLNALHRNTMESSTALKDHFYDDKCIRMARRRFLNYEMNSTRVDAGKMINSQLEQNKTTGVFLAAPYLSTIHQKESIHQYNVKTLLDLRKLSEYQVYRAFLNNRSSVFVHYNCHAGMIKLCQSAKQADAKRMSDAQGDPLLVYHYAKSLNEIFLRSDARNGQVDQFKKELTEARKKTERELPEQALWMRQWVDSFVDDVGGVDTAWDLLKPSEII